MITVDGIKTYSNAEALDALAQHASRVAKTKAIVEIGVYRGGSLRTIAQAARCHVYGIDAWGLEGTYPTRSENPNKYGLDNMRIAQQAVAHLDNVTLTRALSAQAAANYDGPPIGMLYIDSDHTYDAVLADWAAWHPHLAPRAVIAFDDYDHKHPDLTRGVDTIVATHHLRPLEVHGGRLAITRLPQTTPTTNPAEPTNGMGTQ